MGRHVRGQAKHIRRTRRKQDGKLLQRMAAGAMAGIMTLGMAADAVPAAAASIKEKAAEPSIEVMRYVFSGENPVTEEELQQVLAKYRKKPATIKQLEAQAQEVQKFLRNKGHFVSMVYLPPQGFERGVVEMRIVPGEYDKILVKNESYVSDEAVRREMGIQSGDLVNRRNLERGVWLTGDMQRIEAKTQLKAGRKPGTTDLIVKVKNKGPRMWGYTGFDNGGYRYTGRYQYSTFVNYGSPFGNGDLLSLGGVISNHGTETWSGSVSYVTPVLHRGNKLGFSYGRSHYALSGEDMTKLQMTGRADTTSVWWQHNFKRSRVSNWYATVRYNWKELESKSEAFPDLNNPKKSQDWSLQANGDNLDKFWTGGKNTWSLKYTHGNLTIKNFVPRQLDGITAVGSADGAHTAGHFGKFNAEITRLQRINDRVALWLSYSRQWAEKNLDSSEKLSLGGPYGVRAYPIGEASGDDGWVWTSEIRWNLPNREGNPNTWQLISFVDGGHVDAYHDGNSRMNDRGNGRSLYGAGIGVNWSHEDNWAARVHYAWKLGSEKAESDTDCKGRLWFQLYKFF